MCKNVKQAVVKQLAAQYTLTTSTSSEAADLLKIDDNYILLRDEANVCFSFSCIHSI